MEQNKLDNITNWASLYFTPKEICILEELDFEEFEIRFVAEADEVYKAYQKGALKAEAERRIKIKKLANDGSSQAQTLIENLRNNQIVNE